MRNLLDQIKEINRDAATELQKVGFTTDAEIRSLDRQDLLELLPGKDKLRVRKKIHELICKIPQGRNTNCSIEDTLKNVRGLFTSDSLANGLSDNGPLLEYLKVLKDNQLCLIQLLQFTEANIDALESARGNPAGSNYNASNSVADTFPANARSAVSENTRFGLSDWKIPFSFPRLFSSQPSQASTGTGTGTGTPRIALQIASVMCKMVVSGNTLDTHWHIMEGLNGPLEGHPVILEVQQVPDENYQVIIVFCPVVSRAGTDVDAALHAIPRNKPIIVFMMYHMHTPMSCSTPKSPGVELVVNVFFHETKGLLNCSQNQEAITEIKTKLLEYSTKRSCTNTGRGMRHQHAP